MFALAQPRHEVLGVLALIDPNRAAGEHEMFALEHGAVVLAEELAHQRSLTEVELRLRRDLVDDLLGGASDASVFARAEALGHHRSELVRTLSMYLECGGNYDETAEALTIHRSTLRYRLQRIREVSGLDLGEVDSRFNPHVATRAWRVLDGST